MEFSRFGLTVSVRRRAHHRADSFDLAPRDLEALGERMVRYIENLPRAEIQRRLDAVSVDSLDDASAAHSLLSEHGIVIVRNYVDAAQLADVDREVESLCARADEFAASGEPFRDAPDCAYQNGVGRLNTYAALAGHSKPVIQIRGGADKGMVDVFNVDRLSPVFGGAIREGFEAPKVVELLGEGLKPQNLNVYINRGIQKTRGFHVDTYAPQIKGFLYLTDVLELADGPYVYVRGQHRDSVYRKVNRKLSQSLPAKTEAPMFPVEDILPVLAPKGSLVISDQGGIHRGFPQAPHGRRCVGVMNYS